MSSEKSNYKQYFHVVKDDRGLKCSLFELLTINDVNHGVIQTILWYGEKRICVTLYGPKETLGNARKVLQSFCDQNRLKYKIFKVAPYDGPIRILKILPTDDCLKRANSSGILMEGKITDGSGTGTGNEYSSPLFSSGEISAFKSFSIAISKTADVSFIADLIDELIPTVDITIDNSKLLQSYTLTKTMSFKDFKNSLANHMQIKLPFSVFKLVANDGTGFKELKRIEDVYLCARKRFVIYVFTTANLNFYTSMFPNGMPGSAVASGKSDQLKIREMELEHEKWIETKRLEAQMQIERERIQSNERIQMARLRNDFDAYDDLR